MYWMAGSGPAMTAEGTADYFTRSFAGAALRTASRPFQAAVANSPSFTHCAASQNLRFGHDATHRGEG